MAIRVEVNKNIVLLYALLNKFGQAFGEKDSSILREEMVKHFKHYEGKVPDVKQYIHPSKAVFWSLCVSEVPKFEEKNIKFSEKQQREFDYGNYIRPFLLNFYNQTSFETYYHMVLPKLEKLAAQFKKMLTGATIEEVLSDVWGIPLQGDMAVIPNPFTQGSFGPQVGDTNYQVLGVWDDMDEKSFSHNIIHEGSHPLAKRVLEPYLADIEKKKGVLESAYSRPGYPNSYKYWKTCFEEHLVRAVHRGLIAPKLDPKYSVEKGLQFEYNNKGMIFIKKFYDVLIDSKSVSDAVPKIIDNLI